MPSVEILKNRSPVHEAVRPIEHAVVENQAEEKANRQIIERVGKCIPVDTGHAGLIHFEQPSAHDRKDQDRLQRHLHFSRDSAACWPPILNATFLFFLVGMEEVNVVCVAARKQITHRQNEKKDNRELI